MKKPTFKPNTDTALFDEILSKTPPEVSRKVELSLAVADRIRELLTRNGMTQKELAQKMGKKEAQVSLWFSGAHNFTLETLAEIEVALQTNILSVPGRDKILSRPGKALNISYEVSDEAFSFGYMNFEISPPTISVEMIKAEPSSIHKQSLQLMCC